MPNPFTIQISGTVLDAQTLKNLYENFLAKLNRVGTATGSLSTVPTDVAEQHGTTGQKSTQGP